jgi:hypothetical protein
MKRVMPGQRAITKCPSITLHIAAVFPTHVVQRMADLAQAVRLDRFHQNGRTRQGKRFNALRAPTRAGAAYRAD